MATRVNVEKVAVETLHELLMNTDYKISDEFFSEHNLKALKSNDCIFLFRAALCGDHSEIALKLLLTGNCGQLVNYEDHVKASALSFFAACGITCGVKYLLDNGLAEVNGKDIEGVTPLHYAATNGNVECLNLLVKKGADVHKTDRTGHTPLHYAAIKDNIECLNALVAKGAQTKTGMLPLHCAAREGSEKCLKVLLDLNASLVDTTGGLALMTPLHYAAMFNHTICANMLMDIKDMGLNIKDQYGYTAIYNASSSGRKDCLDALPARTGIDIGDDGPAALLVALHYGHLGCAESLLDKSGVN